MVVYRFMGPAGKVLKLDTAEATLLMSTHWSAGRDQSRWLEIYKTKRGNYVTVSQTLWQGERDIVQLSDENSVLDLLLLCEDEQRTEEGDALLAEHEADLVENA